MLGPPTEGALTSLTNVPTNKLTHYYRAYQLTISQVLGTPTEESWPTMADLPEYRGDFPQHDPVRDTHTHTHTYAYAYAYAYAYMHACMHVHVHLHVLYMGCEMSVFHRPQALHSRTNLLRLY